MRSGAAGRSSAPKPGRSARVARGAHLFAALFAGWLFFQAPPPEYRGDGHALVEFVPRSDMTALCDKLGVTGEARIEACSRPGEIVLPNPCAWPVQESYAELACHELGHGVNRWRHDAAGATLEPNPPPAPPPPQMYGPEP